MLLHNIQYTKFALEHRVALMEKKQNMGVRSYGREQQNYKIS